MNSKSIEALSFVATDLLGKAVGQVTLFVNQGGLTNRNASGSVKALFKAEVLPQINYRKDDPKIITGQIICNVSDGKIRTIRFRNWYRQELKNKDVALL